MGVRVPPFAPDVAPTFIPCTNPGVPIRRPSRFPIPDSRVAMKVELTDVSETKKTLTVEVPPEVVETEITRVTQGYARQARIPGFRPGKAPIQVVRKRFREQIMHDVAHDLVPRVVGDALRDKNVQPVDTPKVRDLQLEEGQAADVHGGHRDGPARGTGRPGHPVGAAPRDAGLRGRRRPGAVAVARSPGQDGAGRGPRSRTGRHRRHAPLATPTDRTAGGRDRGGSRREARGRVCRDWRCGATRRGSTRACSA